MKFSDKVDACLNEMKKHQSIEKGSYGEQAVLAICEELYQNEGGILIHSYSYKTDPMQVGNIKKNDDGKFYLENLGSFTEIDVLYVSPYRIFPIEVKAYKAKKITLTDTEIQGCYITNKSPVHQNEMHCRHLYADLFRVLPKGKTDYIVPIVCFVDKCEIEDLRSDWQREYIYVAILDTLRDVIDYFNTPLDYRLNLSDVDKVLKEFMVSNEKYLPVRY